MGVENVVGSGGSKSYIPFRLPKNKMKVIKERRRSIENECEYFL